MFRLIALFRFVGIRLLGVLARKYCIKYRPYIIGVSGSVGKSSCRMIVSQLCSQLLPSHYPVWTPQSNFNGEIGFCLSILGIDSFDQTPWGYILLCYRIIKAYMSPCPYRLAVLEYGVDTPGEMDFLLSIVRPHIGIFTKSDAVHSEQFGNPQRIATEDIKMITATKRAVFLNMDDTYARQAQNMVSIDVFRYKSTGNEWNTETVYDCSWDDYRLSLDDHRLPQAHARISIKSFDFLVRTNLIGKETMGYIVIGLACADLLLYRWEKKLATDPNAEYSFHLTNLPSRLTFFHGKKSSIILDSSYNAAPQSVRAILGTAYALRSECYPGYKILVVLGDMRELGTFSQAEHRKISAPLSMIADKVVLVGQETKKYTKDELIKIGYAESAIFHFGNSILARDFILSFLDQDEHQWLIVVKGSQNRIFLEDVVVGLLANPLDHGLVCRQSSSWIRKKQAFYAKTMKQEE